jgi:hypothetical protein
MEHSLEMREPKEGKQTTMDRVGLLACSYSIS